MVDMKHLLIAVTSFQEVLLDDWKIGDDEVLPVRNIATPREA